MKEAALSHAWWNEWPPLAMDEHVRVGVTELRMFKLELAETDELPRYTLYDAAADELFLIGHEAMCWLVRKGYAMVRGDYPAGSWIRG